MKLYNTQSRSLEDLRTDQHVKFYTCGITPYDTTHLGHAFTYIISDTLIRFLESQDKQVTYVQNVTDIDDDILKKARVEGEDWRRLGRRWTRHFIQDMLSLNMRPPDHFPAATAFIPEIIRMTQMLLENGVAYEKAGNVYFGVEDWPAFGKLSRMDRQKMLPIANERGNHPDDPHKRDPLDFVLWQAQAPDEPGWESPWGAGRPGWHIECAAMATHLLGETVDIHSGGQDLAFPHHECEIAQVEPISTKKPYVRYWLHVAMVHHNGAKMSKSLGNLVMVRDLLQKYPADTIRIYLLRHHYREAWSHSWFEISKAERLMLNIQNALAASKHSGKMTNPFPLQEKFNRALTNDLDTPGALEVLQDIALQILADSRAQYDVSLAQDQLRKFGAILGLKMDCDDPAADIVTGWQRHQAQFSEAAV